MSLWMLYADASRPDAVDVESAVTRAQSIFQDLAFDEAHESVYGMGRYGTEEEFAAREKLYNKAASVCDAFLTGKISAMRLVSKLDRMKLKEHTVEIRKFMKRTENGCKSEV